MDAPTVQQVAIGRFGLGPATRPDAGHDARAAIEAFLARPAPPASPNLPGTAEQLAIMLRRRRATAQARAEPAAKPAATPRPTGRDAELDAWLAGIAAGASPLGERIALHWGNHFTVSAVKGKVGLTAGPFQREAIRPHVFGPFGTMLRAAALHPAMIFYLDNDVSVGPDSVVGRRRQAGLNENLARELLELHTLGADGGYRQADVTALAAVLTGWTVDLDLASPRCGQTVFDPRRHQPGPKTLLGHTYPDTGPDQLQAVLDDLTKHPSTAKHVTARLARSFLGDAAPPAVLVALERRFLETQGDLGAVMQALVRRPEAWSLPLVKMRPPIELMAVAARLLGRPPEPPASDLALVAMGQPYLNPPSPKGWPEEDDGWVTSDGIKTRLDWAQDLARRHAARLDIKALVDGPLRGLLSDESRSTVLRAESPAQGLTLLLMSPDLQRR